MNIRDALREGTQLLLKACRDEPGTDARVLLCHLLQKDAAYIYTYMDQELDKKKEKEYFSMLKKLSKGFPLQYLINVREFMSLDFKVNKNVLIPRHETEILVEEVIKLCSGMDNPKVLELGTGSGCIAVSLAYYLKHVHIIASDISEKALSVAYENAARHNVADKIEFIISDIFTKVPVRDYDIIVSNPPYIKTEDISLLDIKVRDYEPILALDGGEDGLYFYRLIIENAKDYLRKNGAIAFEVGEGQSGDVADLLRTHEFKVNIIKDLQGIERVVVGRNT